MALVLVYLSDKNFTFTRTVNIFIKYKSMPQISKNIHGFSVVAIEQVSSLSKFYNKFYYEELLSVFKGTDFPFFCCKTPAHSGCEL